MSKSPFFSMSSHDLNIFTDSAFGALLSPSHFVALSLEPVVDTATIAWML